MTTVSKGREGGMGREEEEGEGGKREEREDYPPLPHGRTPVELHFSLRPNRLTRFGCECKGSSTTRREKGTSTTKDVDPTRREKTGFRGNRKFTGVKTLLKTLGRGKG